MKSQNNSKGTIRIIGTDGVDERSVNSLDGELTIDLTDEESQKIATSLEIVDDVELPDDSLNGSGQNGANYTNGSDATRVNVDTNARHHGRYFWLALLPVFTFGIGALAAFQFGPSIWSVQASMLGSTVVYAALIGAFAVGLVGTTWMWNDADILEAVNAPWQPEPERYIVFGALGISLLGSGFYLQEGVVTTEVLKVFFGLFIVGIPTSSVIAGPLYIVNRFRTVGILDAQGER